MIEGRFFETSSGSYTVNVVPVSDELNPVALTFGTTINEAIDEQGEVDRYTFRSPGQATAYFYGYSKLNALRARTEIALAKHFDRLAYHDFLVGQGLLPFDLIEKAVMQEFVPSRRGQ